VQLIPGGLLLIGTFWLKESPRWLLTVGKREKAIKNLCWIRNLPADHIYIVEELSYIDASIEQQAREVGLGFWKPFVAVKRDRSIQWRLLLGCLLFMWQNGSGINAINYYSPTVFRSLGITGTNTGFFTTGLFGVVKTSLTFVWLLFLIDHLGRRKLLMIGSFGGSLCMWYVGAYIQIAGTRSSSDPNAPLTPAGISAIFFFYLWTAFYTPSWNGTPWVLNSEMFPTSVRGLGQASASASNWFWNFLISRFTPQMFLKMGYGVYFFFASLMILSVPFVYFLVPETKGIPLEAMDRLFAVRPVRKAHQIMVEELAREDESFRHDAEGAGIEAAKEHFKSSHVEKTSTEV
jgi:sugar porter (SP) family MFS transporter